MEVSEPGSFVRVRTIHRHTRQAGNQAGITGIYCSSNLLIIKLTHPHTLTAVASVSSSALAFPFLLLSNAAVPLFVLLS